MELKRIVNIMPDEKFLDYYIEMSERFIPDQSSYLFFSNNKEFKYVKSHNPNIIKIPFASINSAEVSTLLSSTDKVIFHSFNKDYEQLINNISGKTKLIWIFWGWEGYITQARKKYLENSTRKLRFNNSLTGILKFVKNYFYNDIIVLNIGKKHSKIINLMNYCATWVKSDFELAKDINPDLKHIYFNYYTDELMQFPEARGINTQLETIMLGNSGSPYNNHAEALEFLHEIDYKGIIYCPLSYGGNPSYRQNIERLGLKLFGNHFKPLKTFIPLKEYQDILNSCDVIWMNHKRQQAAGNIFAGFCTGKVVILHPENPMRETFEKWGLNLFNQNVLINKCFTVQQLNDNLKIKRKLTFAENSNFFSFLQS